MKKIKSVTIWCSDTTVLSSFAKGISEFLVTNDALPRFCLLNGMMKDKIKEVVIGVKEYKKAWEKLKRDELNGVQLVYTPQVPDNTFVFRDNIIGNSYPRGLHNAD